MIAKLIAFARAVWAALFPLHVYANDYDMVVARSLRQAKRIWCETTGGVVDVDDEDFYRVNDAYAFSIWCDENGKPDDPEGDGSKLVKLTAAEWATKMGAGFLCSSEY